MSATEACYRIFEYELHANMPHVVRLALHTRIANQCISLNRMILRMY